MENVDITGLVTEDNKNAKNLLCPRCDSKILPCMKANYEGGIEKELHVIHKKQEDAGILKEKLTQFFTVDDMMEFDNVGFTKSVDNDTIKYLICADCEVGPIGWHCIDTKINYVALARVKQS